MSRCWADAVTGPATDISRAAGTRINDAMSHLTVPPADEPRCTEPVREIRSVLISKGANFTAMAFLIPGDLKRRTRRALPMFPGVARGALCRRLSA